ncbi:LacI family DNA-binding transcriptional regulator [Pedobacter sp. ASV1-7]|uniref:LacI family DNA-binding transcriptional regulator n=1 Tax=Pedobacter sp. ASV1-7 TaxID=3145237 RepID=UPI0032E90235
MKNTTIKTISEATQVSLTTVSRVLNGVSKKFRISAATEARVLEAAERLGYTPNQTAINLRLNKSFSIGLVIPTLANPFFSNIASIVNQALHVKGYSVLVTDCDEEEKTEIQAVKQLVARNIDGMIIIPSGKDKKHLEVLLKQEIPVVFIDRYFDNLPISYVSTDHYEGAFLMVNHMIASGHKKIACIQGAHHVMSNRERVRGYSEAMKGKKLPEFYIGGSSFTYEDGYLETKLLMQKKDKPTAIFALSDTILLGVLKALAEDGYNVPEDISITTFDNSVYLDFLACPVTSISQPIADVAHIAIRLLLNKINQKSNHAKPSDEQEKILIVPSIIHRKSVKNLL